MRRKIKFGIVLAALAVLAVCTMAYAITLNTVSIPATFTIGAGTLPNVTYGFYTANGSEVTSFNFAGLMPDSVTTFTYTLKQKSSYDLDVYIGWGYTILPISWLTMDAQFNGSEWSYTDAAVWHATQNVPISFQVNVGDVNNTSWNCNIQFTVSTTP